MSTIDETITVLVADDHPLYREALVGHLGGQAGLEIVAEAGDGAGALAALRDKKPDVAVLDLGLPGLDGIEILEQLMADDQGTQVIILSASSHSESVYRALSAGARGYVIKDSPAAEIVDAVLAVSAGAVVIDPKLQDGLASELRLRHDRSELPPLTAREIEILQLASEGLTVAAIADRLIVSQSTVKTHLQHVYEKFGVSDRTAAVAAALRRGLLR